MQHISALELSEWLGSSDREPPVILDVRETWEWNTARIESSVLIPMGEITARFTEIDSDAPIVCLCHHGMRSMQVAQYLSRQGFTHLFNLTGGIDAWSAQVDPNVARY